MKRRGALPRTPLGNFLKEVPKTFKNFYRPKTAFSAKKKEVLSQFVMGLPCLFDIEDMSTQLAGVFPQ